MAPTQYLFIDESGDPGSGEGDSSLHYAELLLRIDSEGFPHLMRHINNWRYIRGLTTEMKKPPRGPGAAAFLRPLRELERNGIISCCGVYLLKAGYTGPYLKLTSPRGRNPVLFRNFVHRQLLEYHFSLCQTPLANIELVFDRFEMSREATQNLEQYLQTNIRLPRFWHITHADSLYVEALQVVSQLVNMVSDVALGKPTALAKELLDFVSLKDITEV